MRKTLKDAVSQMRNGKMSKEENKITIRSDRKTDYTFMYKGEEVTLKAGSVVSVADGLKNVVFPTVAMKIMNNLIVVKEDVK